MVPALSLFPGEGSSHVPLFRKPSYNSTQSPLMCPRDTSYSCFHPIPGPSALCPLQWHLWTVLSPKWQYRLSQMHSKKGEPSLLVHPRGSSDHYVCSQASALLLTGGPQCLLGSIPTMAQTAKTPISELYMLSNLRIISSSLFAQLMALEKCFSSVIPCVLLLLFLFHTSIPLPSPPQQTLPLPTPHPRPPFSSLNYIVKKRVRT